MEDNETVTTVTLGGRYDPLPLTASERNRLREAAHALALLAAKYEQYRKAAPGLPILAIDITEWRPWAAGGLASSRLVPCRDVHLHA
jgi:hypothetical protein